VAEHLLCKHEALNSNSSLTKKKNQDKNTSNMDEMFSKILRFWRNPNVGKEKFSKLDEKHSGKYHQKTKP
jgi:hypothetical protein